MCWEISQICLQWQVEIWEVLFLHSCFDSWLGFISQANSVSVLWCDYCYLVWCILSLGWWPGGCLDDSVPLKPCLAGWSHPQGCSLLCCKSSAHTLVHLMVRTWGKHLLLLIEIKFHEGNSANGMEDAGNHHIFFFFFFFLEPGKGTCFGSRSTVLLGQRWEGADVCWC